MRRSVLLLCGAVLVSIAASCCPQRACTAKGRTDPAPEPGQGASPAPGQPAAGIPAGGATPHSVETVGEAAEKASESGRPPRGDVFIPKHTIRRDDAAQPPGTPGTDNAQHRAPDGAPPK